MFEYGSLAKSERMQSFPKTKKNYAGCSMSLAFNAHLLWQRQSMPDLEAARREFEDPYAYYSSLCTAMTIPAKLAGFDLTLDLQNPKDVLSEFRKRLSGSGVCPGQTKSGVRGTSPLDCSKSSAAAGAGWMIWTPAFRAERTTITSTICCWWIPRPV